MLKSKMLIDNDSLMIFIIGTVIGLSLVFIPPLISAAPDPGWQYQEDANATTCSGAWDVVHTCAKTYDGNWSSYGAPRYPAEGILYINYTKPSGALSTSLWRVKGSGEENLTILQSCWDYNTTTLLFKAHARATSPIVPVNWSCYNGSWQKLRKESSTKMYEEAMWWNISEAPSDTCTYSGSGNWEVECSDNCSITSNVEGDGSNFLLSGTGHFHINGANVSGFSLYRISGNCEARCTNGCFR